MIDRTSTKEVLSLLQSFPKSLVDETVIYIDLENRQHTSRLGDPLLFFKTHKDKLIILDEVQYMPDIFVDIKSHIDQDEKVGQFLLLGSASEALLQQSAESMAGRVVYEELSGFLLEEISDKVSFESYLFRGVLPRSLLASSDRLAQTWTRSYINTFFRRDLLQLVPGVTQEQVRRLFMMLAHIHGQELNVAKLSKSLSLAYNTVKSYLDTLVGAYQLFMLPAYSRNTGKRLVKSPKVYIADTGCLHTMLGIKNFDQLFSHPVFGFSFEGLVIYNIIKRYPEYEYSFYKTSGGAELDLVIEGRGKTIGVEIKSSTTPTVTRGYWSRCFYEASGFIVLTISSYFLIRFFQSYFCTNS